MSSLLNTARPPAFCPGCSHERIANALDNCFGNMELKGNQIAIVSDIGCGGLFDTFFHTHAFSAARLYSRDGGAIALFVGLAVERQWSPDRRGHHLQVWTTPVSLGLAGPHSLRTGRRWRGCVADADPGACL